MAAETVLIHDEQNSKEPLSRFQQIAVLCAFRARLERALVRESASVLERLGWADACRDARVPYCRHKLTFRKDADYRTEVVDLDHERLDHIRGTLAAIALSPGKFQVQAISRMLALETKIGVDVTHRHELVAPANSPEALTDKAAERRGQRMGVITDQAAAETSRLVRKNVIDVQVVPDAAPNPKGGTAS